MSRAGLTLPIGSTKPAGMAAMAAPGIRDFVNVRTGGPQRRKPSTHLRMTSDRPNPVRT